MSSAVSRWYDPWLTALAPLIWGSTYVVTTEFLPPDVPLLSAALRTLPVGLLMLLWLRQLPDRGWWGKIFLLGFLNIGVFQALLFVAAYRLPGGVAATVGAIQPLVVVILSWECSGPELHGSAGLRLYQGCWVWLFWCWDLQRNWMLWVS